VPTPQLAEQAPFEHTSPVPQPAPQAPQLAVSLDVLVQLPLQEISPTGQLPESTATTVASATASVAVRALSGELASALASLGVAASWPDVASEPKPFGSDPSNESPPSSPIEMPELSQPETNAAKSAARLK
jgi:hypothetical protein